MYELLELLQRLPKPIKALGIVFLLIPVSYLLTRGLGIEKYWWVVVLGMIVIAVAVWAFGEFVKKGDSKRGQAFEGELRRDAEKVGASKQEVREALKELSAKWADASLQLQKTGLSIYSLPWYLLIGEPQSGKSTTLKNSGLEFPVGGDGLSGSGGTRNCDWWFANEAVILDTAGRFTFQEDAAPDASEWSTFLKLLKRYRRYCPINGVLVVVPCTSLLEDSPEELDRKAANIRGKLINLQRVLEIRFPVFVMITKADRILGFSEFFSKLDPVDQKQLVGWSNQVGPEKPYDIRTFDEVFENLLTRIHKLRLKFTANEEIVQNVDRIFVFPDELRAIKDPIKRYFQGIFVETRYDEPFVFRGFYFSSGVQQGKPIARATRELLGASAEGVLDNLEQIFKRSRPFFIKDFYEKKVFPEQGLISRTKAADEREKHVRWATWGLGALIVLMVIGGIAVPYYSLQAYVRPIQATVKKAEECAGKGPCRVAEAYDISVRLHQHRLEIQKKSWLFLMFFRGARTNELSTLLASINRKVYLEKVVVPVLADVEARMGSLDWEKAYDYKAFLNALESQLRWAAIQKPSPGDKPIVRPEDLRLAAAVPFIQSTKGVPWSQRSAEVDEWAAVAASNAPDVILAGVLTDKAEVDALKIPSPERPIKTFESYWTVASLLRWDYRLNTLLGLYAGKYRELIATADDPASRSLLSRSALTGKEFRKVYEEVGKHLATPRVASLDFPGVTPDVWERNLRADYVRLLEFKAVIPAVSDNRLETMIGQLKADHATLNSTSAQYVYLVAEDPQNKAKKAWTPSAAAVSPMLVAVSDYSDLEAFVTADKPQAVVEEAKGKSSPAERKKTIEDFSAKQRALKDKAVENLKALPAIPAEHQGETGFKKSQLEAFVDRTASVAFLFRTLPYAQTFLEREIGPGCDSVCYQRAFAKMMVDLGIASISEAEKVSSRADVKEMAGAVGRLMYDYLVRYIDHFSARSPRGGGGGFYVPVAAVQKASSWREFQGVVQKWNPQGDGGGEGGPAQGGDPAGALQQADVEDYAARSGYLTKLLDYYRNKQAPLRAARAGGGEKASPELVAAVTQFKNNVLPLPDVELKAWRNLVAGVDGVSLRGYHAFTRNPAVRRHPTWGASLQMVERRGANLIRDAIRPSFQQAQEPVVKKIQTTCVGQFPFIRESQLRQERVSYTTGSLMKQSGVGATPAYRLDLATIPQGHFSGVLTDVGVLADEYAINPILFWGEVDFDFIGEPPRSLLAVARGWQIFLSGGTRGSSVIKEHKVEVRPVTFTPSPGRRFIGDRVNALFLFDRSVYIRPSTDFKTGRQPSPFVWRLGPQDAPLSVTGRKEESVGGWSSSLDLYGGPLRFFYFVRLASEDRDRREMDDPEKERDRDKTWTIRVVIPDAEKRDEPLEGLFELVLDEPLPGVLPG